MFGGFNCWLQSGSLGTPATHVSFLSLKKASAASQAVGPKARDAPLACREPFFAGFKEKPEARSIGCGLLPFIVGWTKYGLALWQPSYFACASADQVSAFPSLQNINKSKRSFSMRQKAEGVFLLFSGGGGENLLLVGWLVCCATEGRLPPP